MYRIWCETPLEAALQVNDHWYLLWRPNKVIFLLFITADITGHIKFCNDTQTILNTSVPSKDLEFSDYQSPIVCDSCYSYTDLERMDA